MFCSICLEYLFYQLMIMSMVHLFVNWSLNESVLKNSLCQFCIHGNQWTGTMKMCKICWAALRNSFENNISTYLFLLYSVPFIGSFFSVSYEILFWSSKPICTCAYIPHMFTFCLIFISNSQTAFVHRYNWFHLFRIPRTSRP